MHSGSGDGGSSKSYVVHLDHDIGTPNEGRIKRTLSRSEWESVKIGDDIVKKGRSYEIEIQRKNQDIGGIVYDITPFDRTESL